tara:strand:- start:865 stop:1287 length:423 start_codon:yes stop_codon:yes gene_type:complete
LAINSRNKGANFEREIGNLLVKKLNLNNPVKRILEQTRTKKLPDLRLGRWCIECKRYGDGSEPLDDWWKQVLLSAGEDMFPALIYKFNRKPIKVRILSEMLHKELQGSHLVIDMSLDDFIEVIKRLYVYDIELHESTYAV